MMGYSNLLKTASILLCVSIWSAGLASANVTVATVPVGNIGNAPGIFEFGEVDYAYSIGEYDVTSAQYAAFLNAVAASDPDGLYNPLMAGTTNGNPGIVRSGMPGSYIYAVVSNRGNYPVTEVSFWDTARFANWLSNGQPTGSEGAGTTETGTYTLTSASIAANTVTRNTNPTWAVATENEWYKAAYYSPVLNGGAGGYWPYPTQTNLSPTAAQANYGNYYSDTTPVGTFPYPSYYGTYDQGGDVFQWNESIYASADRGIRGGAWGIEGFVPNEFIYYENSAYAEPSGQDGADFISANIGNNIGFRVVLVPEPADLTLLAVGCAALLGRKQINEKFKAVASRESLIRLPHRRHGILRGKQSGDAANTSLTNETRRA